MSVLLVVMKQTLLCLEVMSRTGNWLKWSGWGREGGGEKVGGGCQGVPMQTTERHWERYASEKLKSGLT